jgi:hypothetical protein
MRKKVRRGSAWSSRKWWWKVGEERTARRKAQQWKAA